MTHILLIYGSSQGQSGKIAGAMAAELERLGHHVDLRTFREAPVSLRGGEYDAVLAGASVHASGYQRGFRAWIKDNAAVLNSMPGAFFSVCLGVLQEDAQVQAQERKIMSDFFAKSGWRPARSMIFAGALSYSQYGFLLKRVMRRIARKAGMETDMGRDYEFTNWSDVKAFARGFGDSLKK